MTDRKKPGVGFWATVVVSVSLVAYPLSIRPVGWIVDNVDFPNLLPLYWTLYAPIIWVYDHGPEPIHDVIEWYANLWG